MQATPLQGRPKVAARAASQARGRSERSSSKKRGAKPSRSRSSSAGQRRSGASLERGPLAGGGYSVDQRLSGAGHLRMYECEEDGFRGYYDQVSRHERELAAAQRARACAAHAKKRTEDIRRGDAPTPGEAATVLFRSAAAVVGRFEQRRLLGRQNRSSSAPATRRRHRRFDFAKEPAGRLAALKDKLGASQGSDRAAIEAAAAEERRLAHLVSNGGRLKLTVERGAGLAVRDPGLFGGGGASDPYVRVLAGRREVGRTRVARRELHPEWNETFEWEVPPGEAKRGIKLAVMDKDALGADDPMGVVFIALTEFVSGLPFRAVRRVEQCAGAAVEEVS